MKIFRFELPNGIRCVHHQVKSPVSYCGLVIGTGSRDEQEDEHGLAHLLEHCLFKGTHKRKAYHINNRLENLGGELNAYTTKEETIIHATTLKTDYSKAAELIADIVFNSTFPEKEIEKEKEIVRDEINSYKDSPSERIFDEYEDLLFAGSSLGHNILGTEKSVAKLNSDSLRKFVKNTYNTDNIVFSSVNGFGEKKFNEICIKYLSGINVNTSNHKREKFNNNNFFKKKLNRETHQAHCILGGNAFDVYDERRITLALLINLIGGSSSNSILNTVVREKAGLSYNIEAGYTPLSDTGIFTIYFSTEDIYTDHCVELIHTELKKITSGNLTERKLSAAKKQFLGQLYISNENNEGLMIGSGRSVLIYDEVHSMEDIAQKIRDITLKDINDVANEIFGKQMSMLIYK
ncbi:MAG: insulinase family protein [Rikenellaceae bacterium]|nr:insulinase family protein [Rikenellaceae bacterium]